MTGKKLRHILVQNLQSLLCQPFSRNIWAQWFQRCLTSVMPSMVLQLQVIQLFCHVRISNSDLICTSKDCHGFGSKGKQLKVKKLCIHLHIVHCFMPSGQRSDEGPNLSANVEDNPSLSRLPCLPSYEEQSIVEPENEMNVSRSSSLALASQMKLLYTYSNEIMTKIVKQDSNSVLGLPGGCQGCQYS